MTEPAPTPALESTPAPPPRNPAVLRCMEAFRRSIEESRARKMEKYDAQRLATAAYLEVVPDLSGFENIRDFIACVAHGMMANFISEIEGNKLLYAAQVATSVLRIEPKPQKKPA